MPLFLFVHSSTFDLSKSNTNILNDTLLTPSNYVQFNSLIIILQLLREIIYLKYCNYCIFPLIKMSVFQQQCH